MTGTYHSYVLALSAHQIQRLSGGHSIRLKHADLEAADGGVPVCLTTTQLNRVKKARAAGKGVQLQFSEAQLAACAADKIGAGFFGDSMKKIGSTVRAVASNPMAQQLAATIADRYGAQGIDAVGDLAAGAINSRVHEGLTPFVDMGMNLGKRYTKSQLDALIKGVKKGSGLYAPGVSRKSH